MTEQTPVTLTIATVTEKGERDKTAIPFRTSERAEGYAAEVQDMAKRIGSDLKRSYTITDAIEAKHPRKHGKSG